MSPPEVAAAKRAYKGRGDGIRSGAIAGLLEIDGKSVRAEVRALIDEALAGRQRASDADRPSVI